MWRDFSHDVANLRELLTCRTRHASGHGSASPFLARPFADTLVQSLSSRALFLPPLRVAENDSEDTAVAAAALVEQGGAVELAQFARDE